MKKYILSGLFLTVIAATIFSCRDSGTGYEAIRKNELEKLDAFVQEHYPTVEPTASGLYYIEMIEGVGDSIQAGDKVQIFYSTWTIDSVLIDETSGYSLGHRFEPYEFIVSAGDAISGLEEGANYMRPGTICNLVIPSELAYGQNGTTGVAGFTTLLMQVEVYKVYPIEVSE